MSNVFWTVQRLLASGRYQITLHAQRRMVDRKVTHADIRACGKNGNAFYHEGEN